jgi:D-proline reductase (dithiol) PrdB
MPLELSRYCIPWTPFRRKLQQATVMLVSTAGIYHPPDPPFEVEGDLSYRRIPSSAAAAELRYADAHYPHDCIDVDLNCVFPADRLRDLVREERIGGVTEFHFSTGFTMALRDLRDQTVPALVAEVTQQRPDAVVLTGG